MDKLNGFIPMTGNPENGNYLDYYEEIAKKRPADIVEAWKGFNAACQGLDRETIARIRNREVTLTERAQCPQLQDACRALEQWDVFANGAIGMPDD